MVVVEEWVVWACRWCGYVDDVDGSVVWTGVSFGHMDDVVMCMVWTCRWCWDVDCVGLWMVWIYLQLHV